MLVNAIVKPLLHRGVRIGEKCEVDVVTVDLLLFRVRCACSCEYVALDRISSIGVILNGFVCGQSKQRKMKPWKQKGLKISCRCILGGGAFPLLEEEQFFGAGAPSR